MFQKIPNLRQAVLPALAFALPALAFAPPVAAAADPEITCDPNSPCRLNQTYGSAFECVVVRGGRVFDRGDGPQCEGLKLADSRGQPVDFCFTDYESPGYPKCGGTFNTTDQFGGCRDTEAHAWIVVNPEINRGYDPFPGSGYAPPEHCRLLEDSVPLGGVLRPEPPEPKLPDADCSEDGMRAVRQWNESGRAAFDAAAGPEKIAALNDALLWTTIRERAGPGDICPDLLAGADPNVRGVNLEGPLHKLAVRNLVDSARFLMLAGADPNAQSRGGLTPLDLVAHRMADSPDGPETRREMAALLREFGGECNLLREFPNCAKP